LTEAAGLLEKRLHVLEPGRRIQSAHVRPTAPDAIEDMFIARLDGRAHRRVLAVVAFLSR
jgi:hypothetical protein